MGAFNEIYYAFDQVAKKSVQIYSDAADYGYPYNTNNPPKEIKFLIDTVKDLQKTSSMVKSRFAYKHGVTLEIQVPTEIENQYERGINYVVSFNKTGKHPSLFAKNYNAFISVESELYSTPIIRK